MTADPGHTRTDRSDGQPLHPGSADEARDAVLGLERQGVDADRIHVSSGRADGDELQRRGADREMARHLFGRGAVGAILGTLLGAAIGLAITLVIGAEPQPVAQISAALGGGAFGGAAGAFYGGTSKLPVTESAVDMPGTDARDIEITVDPEDPGTR